MSIANRGERDAHEPEAPLYCANHPNVETYLRCGRCEKPICARCRVSTPVGFRCFECANLKVLPTYALNPAFYGRSVVGGLVSAAAVAVLIALLPDFEFWTVFLLGIAVPEVVAIAANQKRGPGLQMVAVGCVLFGFVLSRVLMETLDTGGRASLPFLRDLPFYLTQYSVLWLALAIYLAYRRLQ